MTVGICLSVEERAFFVRVDFVSPWWHMHVSHRLPWLLTACSQLCFHCP